MIIGAVTGTLTQPTSVAGRYTPIGDLVIVGRTGPPITDQAAALAAVPTSTDNHPWPARIGGGHFGGQPVDLVRVEPPWWLRWPVTPPSRTAGGATSYDSSGCAPTSPQAKLTGTNRPPSRAEWQLQFGRAAVLGRRCDLVAKLKLWERVDLKRLRSPTGRCTGPLGWRMTQRRTHGKYLRLDDLEGQQHRSTFRRGSACGETAGTVDMRRTAHEWADRSLMLRNASAHRTITNNPDPGRTVKRRPEGC